MDTATGSEHVVNNDRLTDSRLERPPACRTQYRISKEYFKGLRTEL